MNKRYIKQSGKINIPVDTHTNLEKATTQDLKQYEFITFNDLLIGFSIVGERMVIRNRITFKLNYH